MLHDEAHSAVTQHLPCRANMAMIVFSTPAVPDTPGESLIAVDNVNLRAGPRQCDVWSEDCGPSLGFELHTEGTEAKVLLPRAS